MNKHVLALSAATILLSGCATLDHGPNQEIEISTYNNQNPANTRCSLQNSEGAWTIAVNKYDEIKRDGDSLEIRCENDKQQGVKRVEPMFSRLHLYGDILAGLCTVSCLVDGYYNAWYEYPSTVFVLMNPK